LALTRNLEAFTRITSQVDQDGHSLLEDC